MTRSDETICAYCGEQNLHGNEQPEHVLPRAVNGRLVARTVCDRCNAWAGRHVDRPWLDDPFVRDARFIYAIPDRHGNVPDHSPMLTGTTTDGTRVSLGRDGVPVALNSPVSRNPATGEIQIRARNREDYDRLLAREARRAEAAGLTLTAGPPQTISYHPKVENLLAIDPRRWERMAAKVTLGLLAHTQSASWRRGASATQLRERMRDRGRQLDAVALRSAELVNAFAPAPATAVVIKTLSHGPAAVVSLLGAFSLLFPLADDTANIDLAWVSDPISPARSAVGRLDQIIGLRA